MGVVLMGLFVSDFDPNDPPPRNPILAVKMYDVLS